jgi:hypothetical protein
MLTTAPSLSQRHVARVTSSPQVESPAASRAWVVVPPVTASLASARVCIGRLTLSPLQLTVTVHATRPMDVGERRSRDVMLSVVKVSHVACPAPELACEVMASFIADALLSSRALVVSLELLGCPTGLLRSMSRGVHSLLAVPMERARSDGTTGGIVAGVSQGWIALVTHTCRTARSCRCRGSPARCPATSTACRWRTRTCGAARWRDATPATRASDIASRERHARAHVGTVVSGVGTGVSATRRRVAGRLATQQHRAGRQPGGSSVP